MSREARDSRPLFNVRDLPAMVKRITTTDEGKLQILLGGENLDDQTLAKVQDLLMLQQGLVRVSVEPVQSDLFN